MGAPVSGNESSVDYFLGNPPTESEGYLYLMLIIMGHPIHHLLLLVPNHRHRLHLKIILKSEINLERDIKLSLIANTSTNNGLNQFEN